MVFRGHVHREMTGAAVHTISSSGLPSADPMLRTGNITGALDDDSFTSTPVLVTSTHSTLIQRRISLARIILVTSMHSREANCVRLAVLRTKFIYFGPEAL